MTILSFWNPAWRGDRISILFLSVCKEEKSGKEVVWECGSLGLEALGPPERCQAKPVLFWRPHARPSPFQLQASPITCPCDHHDLWGVFFVTLPESVTLFLQHQSEGLYHLWIQVFERTCFDAVERLDSTTTDRLNQFFECNLH